MRLNLDSESGCRWMVSLAEEMERMVDWGVVVAALRDRSGRRNVLVTEGEIIVILMERSRS